MDKPLDDDLCARWPGIFRDRHADSALSCMGRGFECGNGWFRLIDHGCALLQAQADRGGAPQPVAMQVKEKFGSLRFRLVEASPGTRTILDSVCALSAHICETCGQFHRQCGHASPH